MGSVMGMPRFSATGLWHRDLTTFSISNPVPCVDEFAGCVAPKGNFTLLKVCWMFEQALH